MSIRNIFLSKQFLTKYGSNLLHLEVFSFPHNNSNSMPVQAVENLAPLSQSHECLSFMRKWSKLPLNKNREIHLHSENNKTFLTTNVSVTVSAKRHQQSFSKRIKQLNDLFFFQTKHQINTFFLFLKTEVPLYNFRDTLQKTQELFTRIRQKSLNSTFSISAFFINLIPAVS